MIESKKDNNMQTTNQDELNKFEKMADEWWDPTGKFKPLHRYNPVRIDYILSKIHAHFNLKQTDSNPLKPISILDIGCGGGLMSEPFAQLGANVTGIDAVEKNIKIASLHAKKGKLNIEYQATTVEALAKSKQQFDVVFALEIIEHVDNPDFFIESCLKLVKKNGLFFGSTINRTPQSYMLSIIGAEYVLRWLPIGTHEWKKFVTPHEFITMLEHKKTAKVTDVRGVSYSLFRDEFYLSNDLVNNYMLCAKKL